MARKIRVPSAEVERRRVLRIFPFAPVSTSFIPGIRRVNNYTVVGGIQKMQANIGIRERSPRRSTFDVLSISFQAFRRRRFLIRFRFN